MLQHTLWAVKRHNVTVQNALRGTPTRRHTSHGLDLLSPLPRAIDLLKTFSNLSLLPRKSVRINNNNSFHLPISFPINWTNSTNWGQPNKARWAQCLSTTRDKVAYLRLGLRRWVGLAFPTTCHVASEISRSKADHSTSGSKRLGDSKTNKGWQKFAAACGLSSKVPASYTHQRLLPMEGLIDASTGWLPTAGVRYCHNKQ
jgi:hypothetical protein